MGGKGQCENTTNRRVIVTDKHGKQSVQEVKNDLFIGKNDEKAMEDNLRKQGLEFEKMELYAKMDDEKDQFGAQKGRDQFKKQSTRKGRSTLRPANQVKSSRQENRSNNKSDPLKAYRKGRSKRPSRQDNLMSRRMARLGAVMKLQSLFRKHKAKKVLAYKKRCKETRERRQEEMEAIRAKEQARLKRPTGNNRGGFYSK